MISRIYPRRRSEYAATWPRLYILLLWPQLFTEANWCIQHVRRVRNSCRRLALLGGAFRLFTFPCMTGIPVIYLETLSTMRLSWISTARWWWWGGKPRTLSLSLTLLFCSLRSRLSFVVYSCFALSAQHIRERCFLGRFFFSRMMPRENFCRSHVCLLPARIFNSVSRSWLHREIGQLRIRFFLCLTHAFNSW